jgi:hypothetical protein
MTNSYRVYPTYNNGSISVYYNIKSVNNDRGWSVTDTYVSGYGTRSLDNPITQQEINDDNIHFPMNTCVYKDQFQTFYKFYGDFTQEETDSIGINWGRDGIDILGDQWIVDSSYMRISNPIKICLVDENGDILEDDVQAAQILNVPEQ